MRGHAEYKGGWPVWMFSGQISRFLLFPVIKQFCLLLAFFYLWHFPVYFYPFNAQKSCFSIQFTNCQSKILSLQNVSTILVHFNKNLALFLFGQNLAFFLINWPETCCFTWPPWYKSNSSTAGSMPDMLLQVYMWHLKTRIGRFSTFRSYNCKCLKFTWTLISRV